MIKKILIKTNDEYFDFIRRYKEQIHIYEVSFTKTGKIRLFYDIM